MSGNDSNFYAKLLLFGEYSLMAGSGALTIPFKKFGGRLRFFREFQGKTSAAALKSNRELRKFFAFLSGVEAGSHAGSPTGTADERREILFSECLRLEDLQKDLDEGLFFDSDIPAGYGAGSSGALVAALFKRYARTALSGASGLSADELGWLRRLFAAMESYFHGTSSGIDPLSCFVKHPLFFSNDGLIRLVSLKKVPAGFSGGFFQIDTGVTGKTGPLVKGFVEKCRKTDFSDFLRKEYSPAVDRCIGALLENDMIKLLREVPLLSDFQLTHFREMIPPSFIPLWHIGKEHDAFSMKLCGSGGGGFQLGFTKDYETAERYIEPLGMIKV